MANYDKDTKSFIRDFMGPNVPVGHQRGSVIKKVKKEHKERQSEDLKRAAKSAKSLLVSSVKGKGLAPTVARYITSEVIKEAAAIDADIKFPPFDIFNVMMSTYGKDWLDWDPEIIRSEIQSNSEVEYLDNEDAYQTMFAIQTITETNYPMEMWHIFENVGHALNENTVVVDSITPLDIHECALTLKFIEGLRPDAAFNNEINAYIAASAMSAGLVLLPPSLFHKDAQVYLDGLSLDKDLKEIVVASLKKGNSDDPVVMGQIEKIKGIIDYVENNLGEQHGNN